MAISDFAKEYHEKMFPNFESNLAKTDADLVEIFNNFAFDEVINQTKLDDQTRMMAILASLIGCHTIDEFKIMLLAALNLGVTPEVVKEIVYQAVPYVGMGRVYPFLHATNEILELSNISLPLASAKTTTPKTRLEKGIEAQVEIFGNHMSEFYKSGPAETKHINYWLATNCFGDYYTRRVLDLKQREMLTFCFLAALGGCEPQLTSHAVANMRIGNDKLFLIDIVSVCLPFIGYPRSLNAIRCIQQASK